MKGKMEKCELVATIVQQFSVGIFLKLFYLFIHNCELFLFYLFPILDNDSKKFYLFPFFQCIFGFGFFFYYFSVFFKYEQRKLINQFNGFFWTNCWV